MYKLSGSLPPGCTIRSPALFFHAASFLSLDSTSKTKFLKEKFAALKTRIPAWRGMLLSRFFRRSPNTISDSLVLGQIWQSNDRASWAYLPNPYPGVITDIRPAKQYRIFSKPRSEEHTSELQSLRHLVCRLLLEKN